MPAATSASPSPTELNAASALLLLIPPSPAESKQSPPLSSTASAALSRSFSDDNSFSGVQEPSCVSDVSSEADLIAECRIGDDSLQILMLASLINGFKRKNQVLKKPRSKRKSMKRIIKLYGEERSEASVISSITVSSTATSARSARSLRVKRKLKVAMKKEAGRWCWQRTSASTPTPTVRRRAGEIMAILMATAGLMSEVQIREALGNSPDTSKALRMLLRMEKVTRTGRGGRRDPFLYKPAGSR